MELLLSSTLLLLLFISNINGAEFLCYTRVFENKWPHCENVECGSGSTFFLDSVEDCSNHDDCIGFSNSGCGGCLKKDVSCAANGFGSGNYDYLVKISRMDCRNYISNDDDECYIQVWDDIWPHCENVSCFSDKTLIEVQSLCDASTECIGFSYTSGDVTTGNGCLKKDVNCVSNGFGSGGYGYRAKCGIIYALKI